MALRKTGLVKMLIPSGQYVLIDLTLIEIGSAFFHAHKKVEGVDFDLPDFEKHLGSKLAVPGPFFVSISKVCPYL